MRPEVVDHRLDRAERDVIPQPLLRPVDRQDLALVVGRVRAPERLLGDRRRPEVGVVEDRPAVAAVDERRRQVRLPDSLRKPRAAGPDAELMLQLVGHPDELGDPITLGQGGEDRLVPAAADDLHLLPRHERGEPIEERRPLRPEPGEQRAGVVEGEADAGVPLQRLEHRQIGLLVRLRDHPAEVAHRLVVVEGEGKANAPHRDVRLHWGPCRRNHLDTGSGRCYGPKPVC
jgi:hypothetical protein